MIVYIGIILLLFTLVGIIYSFYLIRKRREKSMYGRKSFTYKEVLVILGFNLDAITHFEFVNFNGNKKWIAHLTSGKKKIVDFKEVYLINLLFKPDINDTKFAYVYLVDDLNHIPHKISSNFITFVTNIKQENYTVEQKIYVKK